MNRRGFLKTVAGLAALAAVKNLAGDLLPAPESFRAVPELRGILNCQFIARGSWDGPMMEIEGHSTTVMNCFFKDERTIQQSAIFVDWRLLKTDETIADAISQLGRAS